MSTTLRRRLIWGCLRLARLPSLQPLAVDPEVEAGFAVVADELLAGEAVAVPEPRLDFLRWLAVNRPVVFHGSPRADLGELSTERRSRDTSSWGNQEAVYASTDPVWAIYFACLRRRRTTSRSATASATTATASRTGSPSFAPSRSS